MKYGAVSRETVLEMAYGARHVFGNLFPADKIIGLAVSGIAGPGGGTPQKPVGLLWVGLSGDKVNYALKFQFKGEREKIKTQSAYAALSILEKYLKSNV